MKTSAHPHSGHKRKSRGWWWAARAGWVRAAVGAEGRSGARGAVFPTRQGPFPLSAAPPAPAAQISPRTAPKSGGGRGWRRGAIPVAPERMDGEVDGRGGAAGGAAGPPHRSTQIVQLAWAKPNPPVRNAPKSVSARRRASRPPERGPFARAAGAGVGGDQDRHRCVDVQGAHGCHKSIGGHLGRPVRRH